jgi:hypothetical protein
MFKERIQWNSLRSKIPSSRFSLLYIGSVANTVQQRSTLFPFGVTVVSFIADMRAIFTHAKTKLRCVHPQSIPTERPLLVCKVSANHCG